MVVQEYGGNRRDVSEGGVREVICEEVKCMKNERMMKILFWVIAIPVGVAICMVTQEHLPIKITGCAMGLAIHMLYKGLFR